MNYTIIIKVLQALIVFMTYNNTFLIDFLSAIHRMYSEIGKNKSSLIRHRTFILPLEIFIMFVEYCQDNDWGVVKPMGRNKQKNVYLYEYRFFNNVWGRQNRIFYLSSTNQDEIYHFLPNHWNIHIYIYHYMHYISLYTGINIDAWFSMLNKMQIEKYQTLQFDNWTCNLL